MHREDPLSGVANLFDASIVFAVGLMVALIQAFSLTQLLNPNSQFTIMKKDARTGQVELVEKDHRDIKVKRMTPEKKAMPRRPARRGLSTAGRKRRLRPRDGGRHETIVAKMTKGVALAGLGSR